MNLNYLPVEKYDNFSKLKKQWQPQNKEHGVNQCHKTAFPHLNATTISGWYAHVNGSRTDQPSYTDVTALTDFYVLLGRKNEPFVHFVRNTDQIVSTTQVRNDHQFV